MRQTSIFRWTLWRRGLPVTWNAVCQSRQMRRSTNSVLSPTSWKEDTKSLWRFERKRAVYTVTNYGTSIRRQKEFRTEVQTVKLLRTGNSFSFCSLFEIGKSVAELFSRNKATSKHAEAQLVLLVFFSFRTKKRKNSSWQQLFTGMNTFKCLKCTLKWNPIETISYKVSNYFAETENDGI